MNKPIIMFYELCRLCLDNPGEHNVFTAQGLPEDIYIFTGVRISLADNLPQKICEQCSKTIKNAKELRMLAKKNDINLRSLFDCEEDQMTCETTEVTSSNMDDKSSNYSSQTENAKSNHEKKISVRNDLFEIKTQDDATVKKRPKAQTSRKKFDDIMNGIREKMGTTLECKVCSKKFDKPKKLYLHQRTHNKSLACPMDLCGKKFATKADLEKHVRVHTGVRPYRCDLCDKSFTQRVSLRSHKETVHSEETQDT